MRSGAFFLLSDLLPTAPNRLDRLSVGQARIVAITSVFLNDPPIALLDEPFAGLAPEARKALVRVINSEKLKRSIVIVEHDIDTLFECVDALSVLSAGKIGQQITSPSDTTKIELMKSFYE